MAMLEIKDLEVYYGMIKAIKGVSFEVNEGEVIALIGANGAGKTTILHTITGLLEAKKGAYILMGRISQRCPPTKLCPWVWPMFRKADVYLQILPYSRT